MLHPVHLDVVDAPRGVPRVVDDQAVRVHGVLYLGRVPPGLARIVGLFHVLPLGPLHLLLRGVNEAPEPWKDLLKILKGRGTLCPVVDLGWYRDALPDDRRDLVDGARYRGLAHPEDLGCHVLGGVHPVVEQEQHAVAQVKREPAPGPDCAPAGPLGEPLPLRLRVNLLHLCEQQIEFLEGHAHEGLETPSVS